MTKRQIVAKLRTVLRVARRRRDGTAQGQINAMDCVEERIHNLIQELEREDKRIGNSTIVCPHHGVQPLIGVTDTRVGCEKCYG